MSDRFDQPRPSTPALAGATILQMVPALREEPNARAAIGVVQMLLQSGARALVAGRETRSSQRDRRRQNAGAGARQRAGRGDSNEL